jgi:hypothetical protein
MSNPTTTTCPIALLPAHPSQLTLLPRWRAVHDIKSGPTGRSRGRRVGRTYLRATVTLSIEPVNGNGGW